MTTKVLIVNSCKECPSWRWDLDGSSVCNMNGKTIATYHERLESIDNLPIPDWCLLPDINEMEDLLDKLDSDIPV